MDGVWAEVWFSYFSSVFRPILVLFFFISFCFSLDSGWLTSQYFWRFLTLRLTAFDVAKPALPHPVRPRLARTSPWFPPASAGRRVD
jgi:hypothetical protein